MRDRLLAACLLAALPAGPAAARSAPVEEKPLPVGRTAKLLEGGAVWTVEGRVRVPRGVELTVLKDCTVRAKGSGPAVIEVEGGFDAVGVLGSEVIFENVTVEPQAAYEKIHMDMVIFRGGGGVRTPKDVAVEGSILLQNADFLKGSSVDLLYRSGSVALFSSCSEEPVRLRSRRAEGATKDAVKIGVGGCNQLGKERNRCTPHSRRTGLPKGLEVVGGDEVTLTNSRVGGPLVAVRDWGRKLVFEGMKVDAERLEISQGEPGRYVGASCSRCDFPGTKIYVSSPPSDRADDRLVLDRCWFRGLLEPKAILDKVVGDGADDPKNNGVRVAVVKPSDRPLELAGEADR